MTVAIAEKRRTLNELRTLVRRRLQRMMGLSYLPDALVDLVGNVTLAQLDALEAGPAVEMPPIEALATKDRLALGAPLLEREAFPWDESGSEALFHQLAAMLAAMEGIAGEAGQRIQLALSAADAVEDFPKLVPQEAIKAFIAEDQEYFERFAEALPHSPRAVSFLAQGAVTPSIMAVAEWLSTRVDLETDARPHGHCPVCGCLPLIASLQDEGGKRLMSCSFCRTRYRVPRLGCVLCGEDRTENLGTMSGEEMPGYRIDYCKSCEGFTKAVDLREREEGFLPVLDDLESLPLDMLAHQSGFRRPTVSGLGF